MPDRYRLPALTAALFLACAAAGSAQSAAEPEAPEPLQRGFRADYLKELKRLEQRTLALAGEMPAEHWDQSSGPDIHSFDECLAGLAAASRRILVGMDRDVPSAPGGAEEPATGGVDPPTPKDRRVAELTGVLAAARRAVEETPDEGLEAPIDYLGRRWTVRALFLLILGQTHEALGHAAAHAEALGVPPPWVKLRRASEASGDD